MIFIDWQKHLVLKIIHSLEEPKLEEAYQINSTKNRNGELFVRTNLINLHHKHFVKVSVQNMSTVNFGFQEIILLDIL